MGAPPGPDDRPLFAPLEGAAPGDPGRARRRWPAVLVVLGVLVLVGFALVVTGGKDEREARDARERAAAVARLRATITAQQAPREGAARGLRPAPGASDAERLAARAQLVGAVEASILADARGRARAGELDGPIRAVACGPLARREDAVPDDRDLTKPIGRYDCVAAKRDVVSGEGRQVATLGHPFVAALDFRAFTYVWCRNTPAQGERGEALVFVRLDRRCLAATGRALGTGYVLEGDG